MSLGSLLSTAIGIGSQDDPVDSQGLTQADRTRSGWAGIGQLGNILMAYGQPMTGAQRAAVLEGMPTVQTAVQGVQDAAAKQRAENAERIYKGVAAQSALQDMQVKANKLDVIRKTQEFAASHPGASIGDIVNYGVKIGGAPGDLAKLYQIETTRRGQDIDLRGQNIKANAPQKVGNELLTPNPDGTYTAIDPQWGTTRIIGTPTKAGTAPSTQVAPSTATPQVTQPAMQTVGPTQPVTPGAVATTPQVAGNPALPPLPANKKTYYDMVVSGQVPLEGVKPEVLADIKMRYPDWSPASKMVPSNIAKEASDNHTTTQLIDNVQKELQGHPDSVGGVAGLTAEYVPFGIGDKIANRVLDSQGTGLRSSIEQLTAEIRRQLSGQSVTATEIARQGFLPTTGDNAATILDKLKRFRAYLAQRQNNLLAPYSQKNGYKPIQFNDSASMPAQTTSTATPTNTSNSKLVEWAMNNPDAVRAERNRRLGIK